MGNKLLYLESCLSLSDTNNRWPLSLDALNPAEPYDIIFIDADKSNYPAYLEKILARSQPGQANRILRTGGVIVADNVLRRAMVADSGDDNPWTKGKRDHVPPPPPP